MIHRIFLLLLLLMWLPDAFIFCRFIKPRNSFLRKCRWIYWLPTIVLTLTLLFMLTGDNFTTFRVALTSIYMITYLTIVVPKCLFVLFSLLGSLLALFKHLPLIGKGFKWPIRPVFNTVGVLTALAGAYIILYGFLYGWRRFEVEEITFTHPDVPESFDGYRIVQISDFHMGTISRYPEDIRRAVEIINAQQPDLIAFTGDLVNNEAIELDGVEEILAGLKARDGVFSVLGNHDYAPYRHWPSRRAQAENLADLKRREVAMGWQLLLNENRLIVRGNDSIAVIGVENDGKPPFPSMGDLPRATRGTEGLFKLLLSHDPSHWRRKVLPETDIQLTLSGHTHAMQFRLGDFSPSLWLYPEWAGLYTEDGRGLYVNMGIGSVMIPYRFGAWPEISVITLHRKTGN
ncbi:MAG: metallophosphoesterase [Bacteroidaceae bacterium]|nr:metallophosphoesterase [Bacteroidaceae bacterium]